MSKLFKHFGVFLVIALLVAACTPKATEAPTTAATQPPATTAPTATTAPVATTPPAATGASTPAGTGVPSTGGNIDCKGAASGDSISVVYEWSGNEQDQFNSVVK